MALILGMGAVSPIGTGVPAFVRALREGVSGSRLLPWKHARVRASAAAWCPQFDPRTAMSDADVARLPRLVPMALTAAREALASAGLLDASGRVDAAMVDPSSVAVVLGTGAGGIDFTLDQADAVHHDRRLSLWTITNATHGNLAGELSIRLGCKGASLCVSTGCASASDAAGLAKDLLTSTRPGAPAFVVVVGADAHVRWETIAGMELLGVISTRALATDAEASGASRPFDASRDGFVLGEGAWAIVLARREAAVPHVGVLRGYGATCDAFHRVRPDPDMRESIRAMRLALEDAGLTPDDVGVVHYHGTATQVNDALESTAVATLLGPRATRVPGHSVKSQIGHPQGASGLASLVATLGALRGADAGPPFLPPTINLSTPDPACPLDYTPNVARPADLDAHRIALVNCLAFGAKNSALVVEALPPA